MRLTCIELGVGQENSYRINMRFDADDTSGVDARPCEDACVSVRANAMGAINKYADPRVVERCAMHELENACWKRAQAVASETMAMRGTFSADDSTDLVCAIYRQACCDSIRNLSTDPLVSNGNKHLVEAILDGLVSLASVPSMSASELAPGTHAPAPTRCTTGAEDAATDAFECPRCGERKCTHYELQTRSADEATTVFVTCVACNNRWTE